MELPETDATAALDAFTLAVMASCGQLSLIISHMHRFAAEHGPGDELFVVDVTRFQPED